MFGTVVLIGLNELPPPVKVDQEPLLVGQAPVPVFVRSQIQSYPVGVPPPVVTVAFSVVPEFVRPTLTIVGAGGFCMSTTLEVASGLESPPALDASTMTR